MRQASKRIPESAEKTVRDIRRATRRHHSAEEKIRIMLEGLRGEDSIAELCRKEGINQNLYYRWSKEFSGGGQETARRRHGAGLELKPRKYVALSDIRDWVTAPECEKTEPRPASPPNRQNDATVRTITSPSPPLVS